MSSAQNKSRQSSKAASSPEPTTDIQTHPVSQPPSSEENAMDQPLESTLTAISPVPPAPSTPSETMSSTDSSSPEPIPASAEPSPPAAEAPPAEVTSASPQSQASSELVTRLQPIPPASEPMQYRAIGLVRGKYVASDDQFTRGSIFTDDGYEIGAVLLGRVMSLVKKHVNLEEPHLWVVYPRTKEKGDGDLHVQIVGVWEPENLNRMMDSSEPEATDQELDEPDLEETDLEETDLEETDLEETDLSDETVDEQDSDEPVLVEASESAASAETAEAAEVSAVEKAPERETSQSEGTTQSATVAAQQAPPVPADELDDKYFSVRGEVIYQSVEEQQILVKIRRVPRPGTDESKAFKVILKGSLEGKAVGYFWDLNVHREGNMLVVQDGTMIAAVPPQKRSKKPSFNKRNGDRGRRPGGRPPQGGGPRKPWQNREGSPRPSRPGDRSDRPVPPPTRGENRPPSPRPVKRRNPEKPEG